MVKIHHLSTLGDTLRLILRSDFLLSSRGFGFKMRFWGDQNED